jgi:long-subunit acyl-CoA synthetase (AMP-forming)
MDGTTTSRRRPRPRWSATAGWPPATSARLDDGFLRITDRKKDLFKTSGGKYVAPVEHRGPVQGDLPVGQPDGVHGHDRNFVTAIITLDPDAVTEWASTTAWRAVVLRGGRLRRDAEAVDGYVNELNSRLNRWETIKKFVLPRARPHDRVRRAHSQPEGEAARG